MKHLLLLAMVILGSINYPVIAQTVIMEAGKPITLRAEKRLDADELKAGQIVNFIVETPVKVGDNTVIKAGELVEGRVAVRKNNFIFGIPGALSINDLKTKTLTGQDVRLRGSIDDKGDSRYWANFGWIIYIFPLLFVKGNDGIIEADTPFTLFTLEEVRLAQ